MPAFPADRTAVAQTVQRAMQLAEGVLYGGGADPIG
jgi:hypothetical protein